MNLYQKWVYSGLAERTAAVSRCRRMRRLRPGRPVLEVPRLLTPFPNVSIGYQNLLGSPPTARDVRREKTTDDIINGHAKHAMETMWCASKVTRAPLGLAITAIASTSAQVPDYSPTGAMKRLGRT
jgi:hypothetical protein